MDAPFDHEGKEEEEEKPNQAQGELNLFHLIPDISNSHETDPYNISSTSFNDYDQKTTSSYPEIPSGERFFPLSLSFPFIMFAFGDKKTTR